jgi:translation initiation factor IF-3
LGVVPVREAMQVALEKQLDLVEVSPDADPPVCKILNYGKMRYDIKKKMHDSRKNQKVVELKEIKLRPNIGQNDYEVKLRSAVRFIGDGNKVKFTLRFKGREVAYQDIGVKLFERVKGDMISSAKVCFEPQLDGKQLVMILAPIK